MNIQAVNFNIIYPKQQISSSGRASYPASTPLFITPLTHDCVSFSGVASGGDILKKLAAYGVPDMYTGQILLDPKKFEKMQNDGTFNFPLGKLTRILDKYENTMMPVEKEVLGLLKKISKKQPDISLSEAMKELYPLHKKLLLRAQQPFFEEIIRLACDLPKNLFDEFSELMNITNKRLQNDSVVLPFSEREFLYKLRRISENIKIRNNKNEIRAMNKLISTAQKIFNNEPKGHNFYGRNIKKKLEMQMQPEILKRNSSNLDEFKRAFENSPLRKNEDIAKLLDKTSAKIHGYPSYAQFERKSFIHELKKITRKLKNRNFAEQFTEESLKLPTSKDNISAFIVKYAEERNSKIGSALLLGGTCSVDHILAKKNGGPSKLLNYGLSSVAVNAKKTNIYFDKWLEMHPETRRNCQKYVDRMIELYKQGIFAKVSKSGHKTKRLDKTYIENFAQTIYDVSPENNRINLDISKLYE